MPIQIIESKRLSEKDNLWLKYLSNDLEFNNLNTILKAGREHKLREEISAYLELIIRANKKTFLEVKKMIYPTMEEVLTEAGFIPEWLERGRAQGLEEGIEQGTERGKEIIARNLLKIGMPIAEIAQVTELPVEKVMQINSE